ncbi:MAG: copper chaperone PCu(A)C [Gemmatimonadales bacterium]
MVLAGLGLAACAARPLAQAGDVAITDGFAYPSMGGGGSAFLTLRNDGATEDTVASISSPGAGMVMPHTTETVGDAGRMVPVETLTVPAGGTLRMQSGGVHLMLHGVEPALAAGDSLALVVSLARAGPIRVTVPVVGFADRQ